MGFPDRFITVPAFDSAGAHFQADRPLGAGRVQLAAHNARLVARRNAVRPLVDHPGWRGFYRAALVPALAPPTASTGPVIGDIDWSLKPKSGGVTFCSGPHYAWQYPDGRWPRVRFSWTWMVEGGNTAGAVVAVVPEGQSVLSGAAATAARTITTATWTRETAEIQLSRALVRPTLHEPVPGRSTDPPQERVTLYEFRVYLGAYCSSNTDASGQRASLVGLSVGLIPPP